MQKIAPNLAFELLEGTPVVLVTTVQDGRPNVMTMGHHMMISHDPPLLACIIGPWDYSHAALVETGQCVLAIPSADLADKVIGIGSKSGMGIDKFKMFGLSIGEAAVVDAPTILDCVANLECKVVDETLADKYALHVLEVVAIQIDEACKEQRLLHQHGTGMLTLDGEPIPNTQHSRLPEMIA